MWLERAQKQVLLRSQKGARHAINEDSRVKFPERPFGRKYRSKGHYNYIGLSGSILIETLEAEVLPVTTHDTS